jgi:hypothetical protein
VPTGDDARLAAMSDTEDSAPESAPEPAPEPISADPDPGEIPLVTVAASDDFPAEPDPGPITLEEEFRGGHQPGGIARDE